MRAFVTCLVLGFCAGSAVAVPRQTACARADGVWVRLAPDGPVRLAAASPARDPRWSPSGRWLVYANQHDGNTLLDTAHPDTPPVGLDAQHAVWSPTADVLAYTRHNGGVTLSWPGTKQRPLDIVEGIEGEGDAGYLEAGEVGSIVWSPDGQRIDFTTAAGGVDTVHADGLGWHRRTGHLRAVPAGNTAVWEGQPVAESGWELHGALYVPVRAKGAP